MKFVSTVRLNDFKNPGPLVYPTRKSAFYLILGALSLSLTSA
jgi:hypothetical protein